MPPSQLAGRLVLLSEHIVNTLDENERLHRAQGGRGAADIPGGVMQDIQTLARGIEELETEQRNSESMGNISTRVLKEREDVLIGLQRTLNELDSRYRPEVAFGKPAAPLRETQRSSLASWSQDESGNARPKKSVRFREEAPSESDADLEVANVFHLQQDLMDDQDTQLDSLAANVRRQRELSIEIGGELDEHNTYLDGLSGMTDSTMDRLGTAGRRLDRFARKAKANWNLTIIFVLIIVLVFVIAI